MLVEQNFACLKGLRVALLANHASVDHRLTNIVDIFKNSPDVNLVKIFAPEHGFDAAAQDQITLSKKSMSDKIEVVNLYGQDFSSLWPSVKDFDGVDLLVADLQDIGSRYYTFYSTIAFCMEVAKKAGVRVMVLDRPNPIGGVAIEGAMLHRDMQSFVGYYNLPVRHAMTMGELLLYINRHHKIDAELEIIKMRGWKREMYFDQTNLPFVMPSPNMPTVETAIVYPGGCLLEGTNISEGRGTTRPFELFGMPDIDHRQLKADLDKEKLSVVFRPISFQPTFHKHAGMLCKGLQVHIQDRKSFAPWITYTMILKHVYKLSESFDWYRGTYEYVSDRLAIDLLFGDIEFREAIEAGADRVEIERLAEAGLQEFKSKRQVSLLYLQD